MAISRYLKWGNTKSYQKWKLKQIKLIWTVYQKIAKVHNYRVRKCRNRVGVGRMIFQYLRLAKSNKNALQISRDCKYKENKNLHLNCLFQVVECLASHLKKDEIFRDIHFFIAYLSHSLTWHFSTLFIKCIFSSNAAFEYLNQYMTYIITTRAIWTSNNPRC